MKSRPASPQQNRLAFVAALEAAKDLITRGPASARLTRDGPSKLLGSELRIAPARITEFMNPNYWIKLAEGGVKYDDARLRKTIGGFAASVHRAVSWLKQKKITKADSLTTVSVIECYWPKKPAIESHDEFVKHAIEKGIRTVSDETARVTKIDVELWVPSWGPFAEAGKNPKTTFYSEYGNAILRGIDPIGANIERYCKTLAETLELPARTHRGPWAVAMGPYSALHRRFHGLEFVTFPLRFPLVGLIASLDPPSGRNKELAFKSFFQTNCQLNRVVVSHDVGHYVLCSMVPDTDADPIKKLPTDPLEEVPELVYEELGNGKSIAFLGDGMLAFEVFAHLFRKSCYVRVIEQEDPFDPDFAFMGGMMYREEDRKFARLLEDSQHQFFRSQWRVADLFTTFLKAVVAWHDALHLVPKARDAWRLTAPNHPLFLIRSTDVSSWSKNKTAADDIVKDFRERIKAQNEFVQMLFQTVLEETDDLRIRKSQLSKPERLKQVLPGAE